MKRSEFRAAYRNARSLFRLAERFSVLPESVFSFPRGVFHAANAVAKVHCRPSDALAIPIRWVRGPGLRFDRVNGGLRA